MKNIKLILAAIMTLNFSAPAFANQAGSMSEADFRKIYIQTDLKIKGENLKALMQSQWIIENMFQDNAEAFYVKNFDNPWIGAALGILTLEGILLGSTIISVRDKGITKKNVIDAHLKEWKASFGAASSMLIIFGFAGAAFYGITMGYSDLTKERDKFKKLAKERKLEAEYRKNQEQIIALAREIVELKQQLGN